MLIELWGHWKANGLSLLADALHLLVDIAGFLISIITLRMSKKPETSSMTFGYHRIEIIGALASVFFIWAAVGYLVTESIHKYVHPQEIDGLTFFGIAVIGLFVNIGCVFVLHSGDYHHSTPGKNLNIRATYIHVIGDIIQSIGVIIASFLIYLRPSMIIADVFCTLFFAVLVLISTIPVVRDGVHILSEGAPKEIDQEKIKSFILLDSSVIKITDLKVWSISVNKYAASIKILTDHILIKEYENLLIKITKFCREEMKIEHVNIEINTPQTSTEKSGFKVEGVNIQTIPSY